MPEEVQAGYAAASKSFERAFLAIAAGDLRGEIGEGAVLAARHAGSGA